LELAVTAEQVACYLRQNPDFLVTQPELLMELAPPVRWSEDAVVDMQQFMVNTLRGELDGLRDCAQAVIETSRCNMDLQRRTHAAVLELLAAPSLDGLARFITDDLPVLLDVDAAALGFEPVRSEHPPSPSMAEALAKDTPAPTADVAAEKGIQGLAEDVVPLAPGDVDRLLGAGREVALIRSLVDDGGLFDHADGAVLSAAFARLQSEDGALIGLLALGSFQESTFHPGQGTELIAFLAKIVQWCAARLIATSA
jgi:hypothetical protein